MCDAESVTQWGSQRGVGQQGVLLFSWLCSPALCASAVTLLYGVLLSDKASAKPMNTQAWYGSCVHEGTHVCAGWDVLVPLFVEDTASCGAPVASVVEITVCQLHTSAKPTRLIR